MTEAEVAPKYDFVVEMGLNNLGAALTEYFKASGFIKEDQDIYAMVFPIDKALLTERQTFYVACGLTPSEEPDEVPALHN